MNKFTKVNLFIEPKPFLTNENHVHINSTGLGESTLMLQIQNIFRLNVSVVPQKDLLVPLSMWWAVHWIPCCLVVSACVLATHAARPCGAPTLRSSQESPGHWGNSKEAPVCFTLSCSLKDRRKLRCRTEMGFGRPALKLCGGKQEQVEAVFVVFHSPRVRGLHTVYTAPSYHRSKRSPELTFSSVLCEANLFWLKHFSWRPGKIPMVWGTAEEMVYTWLIFEAVLMLMSSFAVSLSFISHSGCKAETNSLSNWSDCKSSTIYPWFIGTGQEWRKHGTKSIWTSRMGEEIITVSRPYAVAGG